MCVGAGGGLVGKENCPREAGGSVVKGAPVSR